MCERVRVRVFVCCVYAVECEHNYHICYVLPIVICKHRSEEH